MSKWQHRREFLRLTRPTARNLFQAWRHWTQFALLNKQSKQHAKQIRKIKFAEVIQQAQHAARRHDSHTLFNIIHKHAQSSHVEKCSCVMHRDILHHRLRQPRSSKDSSWKHGKGHPHSPQLCRRAQVCFSH